MNYFFFFFSSFFFFFFFFFLFFSSSLFSSLLLFFLPPLLHLPISSHSPHSPHSPRSSLTNSSTFSSLPLLLNLLLLPSFKTVSEPKHRRIFRYLPLIITFHINCGVRVHLFHLQTLHIGIHHLFTHTPLAFSLVVSEILCF